MTGLMKSPPSGALNGSMRHLLFAMAVALPAAMPAGVSAADVGISVDIGQPGFYGRIDIGRFPRPPVLYPQPVIIAPAPVPVYRQPIYLRVPPGHARHWDRHCARYAACGQQTYFVDDHWYRTVYAPQVIRVAPHDRDPRPPGYPRSYRGDDRRDDRHGGKRRHRRDD